MHALLIMLATVTAPNLSVVTLRSVRAEIDLGPRLEVLRDTSRALTLADVRGAHAGAFRPTGATPNYGFTTDAAWFRLELRSALRHRQLFYLDVSYVILDRVEVYVASVGDKGPPRFRRHLFGDTVSASSRMAVPSYTLPITLDPGETKQLYFRVTTGGALQVPMTLHSPDGMIQSLIERLLLYGPMLGLLFVLLIYDLFLFAMVRDRSYLDFALCVLFALIYVLYLSGVAQTFLLPDNVWLTNSGYVVAMISANLFMYVFTRRFLALRERFPWADRFFGALLLLGLLVYPLSLFAGYRVTLLTTVLIAVSGAAGAMVTGAISLRRGYKPARFYVLGWSTFFLGILVFAAQKTGLIDVNMLTDNAAVIGFLSTVVVLPMGLADRINLLRAEQHEAQERALELKARMAADLRVEVQRKTEDLRVANRELAAGNERLQREIEHRALTEQERQALERRLFESQKLDAIGRLAGGVAHDMNNILAAIGNNAAALAHTFDDDDPRVAELDDVLDATRRGGELAHNLLGFARRGQYRKEPLDMHQTIDEMHRLLRRTIHQGIEIALELAPTLRPVEGDASQLGQVLVNLAVNAAQAMGDKGTLTIRTANLDVEVPDGELAPGRYIRLEVQDTGSGMDEDTLARAFEPFFTTKPPGEGTGLGLSMVYGAVQVHGGQVSVNSAPGEGTTVRVVLPAYEGADEVAPPSRPSDTQPNSPCSGYVLLVDDERLLRRGAARLLKRVGCEVLQAEDGQQALELYRRHATQIGVVVLDLVMPVMDGFETFRQLRQLDAELPIVLSSGYSPEGAVEELLTQPGVAFVQKPYGTDQLLGAITSTLPTVTARAS